MNGNYLLDTSILIELLRKNHHVLSRLEQIQTVLLPFVAVGELYYGAFKSHRGRQHEDQIRQLVSHCVVLTGDDETGYWYGFIKNRLWRKGQPIPENDIWIAAIAMQFQLTVATRDKHFLAVDDLRVEMWS